MHSGPKPLSMSKRNIRTRELRAARKAGVAPPPAPPVERKKPIKIVNPVKLVASDLAMPESRRVTILELGNRDCRFPLGDPAKEGFSYCGAERESIDSLKPYCSGHAAIAYRPSKPSTVKAWR